MAEGLQPTGEKVEAVNEVPPPNKVSQLQSFLRIYTVNYYGKFLPHLTSTVTFLCNLLQETKGVCWGLAQDKAFKKAKKLLTSQNLLVHFDATRELVLSCVSSPCGLGAVLSHRALDSTDQPRPPAPCQSGTEVCSLR